MSTVLETTAGDLRLEAIDLHVGDRAWSILHTDAVISYEQERAFLGGPTVASRPYGVVLWPAALALAHELASRDLVGARILELGAGTGLPGIVAASRGARVVQTDRQKLALHVCAQNAARNNVAIEHRVADWTAWTDTERYDFVIGSDILYNDPFHPFLVTIFTTNLADTGTVLLSDPFRAQSMGLFESLEAAGWTITMDKWSVGIAPPPRPIGVFALRPPRG